MTPAEFKEKCRRLDLLVNIAYSIGGMCVSFLPIIGMVMIPDVRLHILLTVIIAAFAALMYWLGRDPDEHHFWWAGAFALIPILLLDLWRLIALVLRILTLDLIVRV